MRLVSQMPDLISLELYWILCITDKALMTLAAYNLHLERLSLSGCKHITDQGLKLLVGMCQELTHLNLTRQAFSAFWWPL